MNVDMLIFELAKRFPNAPLQAWTPDFHRELAGIPPAMLRRAFEACIGEWTEPYAPKPAHFLNALRPLAAARDDAVLKEQWRRREEGQQIERERADPEVRARIAAMVAKAKAHLSSLDRPLSTYRSNATTINKPLPAEVVERIRKDAGQ